MDRDAVALEESQMGSGRPHCRLPAAEQKGWMGIREGPRKRFKNFTVVFRLYSFFMASFWPAEN